MAKKHVVVIDKDRGARVLVNPADMSLFADADNVLIDPDMTEVMYSPPHYWDIKDGRLVLVDNDEAERRENLLKSEIPSSEAFKVIVKPKEEPPVIVVEQPKEQKQMFEEAVELILSKLEEHKPTSVKEIERVEIPVIVEKEVIRETVKEIPVERVIESVRTETQVVEVNVPQVIETTKIERVEIPVIVEKQVDRVIVNNIPTADEDMRSELKIMHDHLHEIKKSLENTSIKCKDDVIRFESKFERYSKYLSLILWIQVLIAIGVLFASLR